MRNIEKFHPFFLRHLKLFRTSFEFQLKSNKMNSTSKMIGVHWTESNYWHCCRFLKVKMKNWNTCFIWFIYVCIWFLFGQQPMQRNLYQKIIFEAKMKIIADNKKWRFKEGINFRVISGNDFLKRIFISSSVRYDKKNHFMIRFVFFGLLKSISIPVSIKYKQI